MSVRALILGTTGVEKNFAISQLAHYRQQAALPADFAHIDFDKDYIQAFRNGEYPGFLDASEDLQYTIWQKAWDQFCRDYPADGSTDIVLCMHGVLVRPHYGVRPVADVLALRHFNPTHIITLIDDVYMQWSRTETRAAGADYKGRPTLTQLLDGRKGELLLGDMVHRTLELKEPISRWLLATRHPARVLERVIFSTGRLSTIYLSIPISVPRQMADAGDLSGIQEVNSFLRRAADLEHTHRNIVCLCPLTIDELPLTTVWDKAKQNDAAVLFDIAGNRWDVRAFYQDDLLMSHELPTQMELVNGQVRYAEGLLKEDVGVRDYRLVQQSDTLLVFNPWFRGERSTGVRQEVDYAIEHRIPVHVFQDQAHDPEQEAYEAMIGPAGSLGRTPGVFSNP